MARNPRVTLNINADDIIRQLRGISDGANKGLSKGLNDLAFELRRLWLADIKTYVDKPVSFTKKVFVKKAYPDNLISKTFIPPIQSRYLEKIVDGGLRRPGDYATLDGQILSPVNARLTKAGNFSKGPKRWIANIENFGRFGGFVGAPGEGDTGGQGAVYQRMKSGLKLLAVFEQTVTYDQTLPLEQTTNVIVRNADDFMQQALDRFLRS